MPAERQDVERMLKRIRMDLTDLQSKVSVTLKLLGEVSEVERPRGIPCTLCGVFKNSDAAMADHLANVHGA